MRWVLSLTMMTISGLHLAQDLCLEAVHLLDLRLDLGLEDLGLEDLEDLGPAVDQGERGEGTCLSLLYSLQRRRHLGSLVLVDPEGLVDLDR